MIDLSEFGPLYHDYSVFGAKSIKKRNHLFLNQQCKEKILSKYIQYAVENSKETKSFAELFCADAYFAMLALYLGATHSLGIDNNRDKHSTHAQEIAKKLNLNNFKFLLMDINKIDTLDSVDIVANIGGLYHVSNPEEILLKSYNMAKQFLIVQSVVSTANSKEDFFVSPAPGWKWGCRYNKVSFDKMINKFGWNIIKQDFNELVGNKRDHDRGSVYYLIKV